MKVTLLASFQVDVITWKAMAISKSTNLPLVRAPIHMDEALPRKMDTISKVNVIEPMEDIALQTAFQKKKIGGQ